MVVRTEVDPAIRPELDDLLVAALRVGNTDGMHLAQADQIEWEVVAGFNYTGGKKTIRYPELDLQNYLQVLGDDSKSLSLDQLKRHKVRLYEDSTVFHEKWSVYECFVWETDWNKKKFVLFDGRWFEIEQSYASFISKFVNSISSTSISLPQGRLGQTEADYNESVANGDPRRFALFDQELVHVAGAASPIEFCDLLSIDGHFVHVKKRSASATLSHLFSQGSVSSDAFLRDEGVRNEIRSKLNKLRKQAHTALIPANRPTPPKYEIVYAVLTKAAVKWPPNLPFFSAVNLMHHANRIQNLGFKVSLQHIKQV